MALPESCGVCTRQVKVRPSSSIDKLSVSVATVPLTLFTTWHVWQSQRLVVASISCEFLEDCFIASIFLLRPPHGNVALECMCPTQSSIKRFVVRLSRLYKGQHAQVQVQSNKKWNRNFIWTRTWNDLMTAAAWIIGTCNDQRDVLVGQTVSHYTEHWVCGADGNFASNSRPHRSGQSGGRRSRKSLNLITCPAKLATRGAPHRL